MADLATPDRSFIIFGPGKICLRQNIVSDLIGWQTDLWCPDQKILKTTNFSAIIIFHLNMVWIFMITVKYNLYIWSLHPRALAFDFHFKTGRASELKPVICPLTSLALLLWKAQTPLCLSHLAPSTSYKMLALFSSNTSPLPLTPSSKLGSSRNPAFASHNPACCHLITLWVPSVLRLNSQLKLVLSWILWQYSGMQLDLKS